MRFAPALIFCAALCAVSHAEEEEPPIVAQVYYSKDDAKWRDAEKAIDAVVKKFPILRVEKISIDTDEGYQKLAAAEKANGIEKRGDITLVSGSLTLIDTDERRDIETFLEPMLDRLLHPEKAKGRLKADVKGFAKDVFGHGVAVEALPGTPQDATVYHRIKKDGKDAGWVVEAYRPIGCPVCNDSQFMLALDSELKTVDLRPVRELERWGRKLDEKESAAFTKQFKGRTADGKAVAVDGISGATKTTHTYERAVAEILKEIKVKAGAK